MVHPIRIFQVISLLALLGLPATASTFAYQIFVDTTSQSGAYGYIDLELNAGSLPGALPIVATVTDFSGAALNPSDPNNDKLGTASGDLASQLTLDNSGFNDYFEGLTFANSVSFNVLLSGPGIDPTGNAGGTSGTTFQVFFYDSTGSNTILSGDPTGAADLINVAANGQATTTGDVTSLPEPASAAYLMAAAIAVLAAARWKRLAASRV